LLSVPFILQHPRTGDGAALVLDERTPPCGPSLVKIFADAGYPGPARRIGSANSGSWVIEVVKRTEMHQFVVLPSDGSSKDLAWISINRRMMRDFERYARTVAVRPARMIKFMLRRLTR